jgi:hypothetical protein
MRNHVITVHLRCECCYATSNLTSPFTTFIKEREKSYSCSVSDTKRENIQIHHIQNSLNRNYSIVRFNYNNKIHSALTTALQPLINLFKHFSDLYQHFVLKCALKLHVRISLQLKLKFVQLCYGPYG